MVRRPIFGVGLLPPVGQWGSQRLLGNPPYIMLRTHDIEAKAWTAGLASRDLVRYRCARLAMMVAHYATDRDLPLRGTEAQKELMRAARRLS